MSVLIIRCMKQQQRSMLLFEQTIKSQYTLRNYRDHLKRFLKFTKLKNYDSLLKPSKDDIQIMIEDYVMDLKKTVSPNSVDTMVRGVRHFYVINKIGLYWDLISKLYPEKIKASGFMPYSNDDIRSMLSVTTSKRNKAIIHFLASTGSRIGIFDYDLSMKHLKSMDNGCMSVLVYADDIQEYLAFLTQEATDSLNDYFQERQDEEERIKRMRELISQFDIKNKVLDSREDMTIEIKKLKCPKCDYLYFPKLDDRSCPKCSE